MLSRNSYLVTTVLAAITCAAAPAYVIRPHFGPVPTTVLELAILFTLAAFAIESYRLHALPPWRSQFGLPALVFVVAGAISVIVSPNHYQALGLYRAYILEPIAFFYAIGNAVSDVRRAWLVLLGLGIGGAIAGLANSFVVLNAIRHHALNLAIPPPVVIYNTANAVALYLVPLIGIGASIAIFESDRRVRLTSAAFAALFVASTFLSLSRGGLLALTVVLLVLAVVHPRRLYMVPAVVTVGLLAVIVPGIRSRLAHEFDPSDPNNTFLSRLHLWQATIHMLRDHPLFGGGLFGFAKAIQAYRGGVYEENLIYPHNLILNFWTETGLLGLVAFLWLLVQTFMTGIRGWTSGPAAWRPIQLGIVLAMVATVVHGMVDVPYFKNDLALEFWVFLGLCWAGSRYQPRTNV